MKHNLNQILLELNRRNNKPFQLESHLFDKQLTFVNDPEPFKTAVTSRRAGKSTACAADLIDTASTFPECTALYVTGARTDAKKIVWAEAKRLNQVYGLQGISNESELTLTFPNQSILRLAGAKDMGSIEKIRGQMPPVKKAYIDEAQAIRDSLLTVLIDDILEPALMDYGGSLALIGTPSAVPSGYFHRASHSKEWSNHKWTFFDNPHIALKNKQSHDVILARVLKRRGVTLLDPSIRREYFGEWVPDSDSLVYHYNPEINNYDALPATKSWNYILGVDLGFDDADALAVLAWSDASPITYLVEEKITRKQGISELVEQIELLRRTYGISKVVVDQGGLGKKIAEELSRRYLIAVQPAEKHRKVEYIELMNDALRTGRLMAKATSQFADECMKVEWDKDKSTPDKKKISDRFHSDICEAVLYAWRESYSFTHVPEPVKAVYGTPEWAKAEAEGLEAAAEEYFKAKEDEEKGFNSDGY